MSERPQYPDILGMLSTRRLVVAEVLPLTVQVPVAAAIAVRGMPSSQAVAAPSSKAAAAPMKRRCRGRPVHGASFTGPASPSAIMSFILPS